MNRQTGPARRRRSRNGFRGAKADGRWRCSTAGPRSAPRSRRSSSSGFYQATGSWRPAFIVTGALGLLWIPLFRWLYRSPEDHPRLAADEREDILQNRAPRRARSRAVSRSGTRRSSRLPQTWGILIGKALTDPVWFFITDWFAIYLASRGFPLADSLLAFWVPFMAADLGNFAGGGASSALIKRGWQVGTARKTVIVLGSLGMLFLIPAIYTTSLQALAACFAVATFSYAAVSTMILNLPADVYPARSVGTVAGLGGTAAGIGTIAATWLIGFVADRYSFEPLLIGASLIPLVGMVAVLILVRNNDATRSGIVNPI